MKFELTPVEKAAAEKVTHEALDHGFEEFKAKLELHPGDSVNYRLWMGSVHELRGPVKIVDLKRQGKKITHVKLEDSPCWLKIADILR